MTRTYDSVTIPQHQIERIAEDVCQRKGHVLKFWSLVVHDRDLIDVQVTTGPSASGPDEWETTSVEVEPA